MTNPVNIAQYMKAKRSADTFDIWYIKNPFGVGQVHGYLQIHKDSLNMMSATGTAVFVLPRDTIRFVGGSINTLRIVTEDNGYHLKTYNVFRDRLAAVRSGEPTLQGRALGLDSIVRSSALQASLERHGYPLTNYSRVLTEYYDHKYKWMRPLLWLVTGVLLVATLTLYAYSRLSA